MATAAQNGNRTDSKALGTTSPAQTSLRTKSLGTKPIDSGLTSFGKTRVDDGIVTLRYEETTAAKPPIPVTVAPPRNPPSDTHPALRREGIGSEAGEGEERKRDSGLAPTTSSKAREGSVNTSDGKEEGVLGGFKIDFGSNIPANLRESAPATPKIRKSESVTSSGGSMSRWRKPGSRKGSLPKTPPAKMASPSEEEFSPITTPIPTDSLLDEEFLETLSFSKRGSMMLGGKKAVTARQNLGRRQPSFSMLASPSIKILSDDVDEESKKVRSMYEASENLVWNEGRFSSMDDRLNPEQEVKTETPEL
jgi:hypothetical protein